MARITAPAKQAARSRLLEMAARHFALHGLDGANVDDTAHDAGFAKGTLYNYFRSKEQLFAEVLAEGCRRVGERYTSAEQGRTVRQQLVALVAADIDVLREEEGFMKVLVREAMSFRAETYPLIIENLGPFLALVEDILRAGVETGEVRSDMPPRQLALLFVGILTTMYVQHWGTGGGWPALEELPELVATTFLEGAAARTHDGARR